MSAPRLTLDGQRLWNRVNKLAQFSRPDSPWTRRAFSPEFCAARQWLAAEFEQAGLEIALDAGGNLVGRLSGTDESRKPLISGSHCDTVMQGGRFDGTIGVLAALEVAQTLRERGHRLNHPLEVIDFLSEEPSDYGISCVGSRAFSGQLDAQALAATDESGETLAAALKRIGADPAKLATPLRPPDSTAAFLELHIEQGPVLENLGVPIGVVTNIVGIRRVAFTLTGRADHAGTTPMGMRRDALLGATYIVQGTHSLAHTMRTGGEYLVATVGRMVVMPNVANAVAGKVDLVLEVRSTSATVLDTFPETLIENCTRELEPLGIVLTTKPLTHSRPTACSSGLIHAIEQAAATTGFMCRRLPSGAGHDAVYVARTGPIGMIFIPCREGRSHCAEESIEPGQLLDGTRVLMQTLLDLDVTLP
jgi:beta-ureidopropionase / N-carbamoyl-L-amino-acid hydrolase